MGWLSTRPTSVRSCLATALAGSLAPQAGRERGLASENTARRPHSSLENPLRRAWRPPGSTSNGPTAEYPRLSPTRSFRSRLAPGAQAHSVTAAEAPLLVVRHPLPPRKQPACDYRNPARAPPPGGDARTATHDRRAFVGRPLTGPERTIWPSLLSRPWPTSPRPPRRSPRRPEAPRSVRRHRSRRAFPVAGRGFASWRPDR